MARSGKWKKERATVHKSGVKRAKSRKYSSGDEDRTPNPNRTRIWVAGYTRKDGRRIEGHYRKTPAKIVVS